MIRIPIVVVVLTAGALLRGVQAQTAFGDADDTRYSFNRVDDGYLRLDMRSGEVSLCNRRTSGWSCEIIADDRRALDADVSRLRAENAALKKTLLDHALPLPTGVSSDPVPSAGSQPGEPARGGIEQAKALVGKMWWRLVELIANLRRNVLNWT